MTRYVVENNYALMALTKQQLDNSISIIDDYKFSKYKNNKDKFTLDIEKEINSLFN